MTMPELIVNQELMDQLSRLATRADVSIETILSNSLQQYEAHLDSDGGVSTSPPAPSPRSREAITESPQLNETALFKRIAENILDMVCLHEPDGRVIYASPSGKTITGFEIEELVGTNPYTFFHPDDLETINQSHLTSLTGEKVRSVIYRHRCKNGAYIWMDTLTAPIVDETGNIANLLTVSRDITERIEAANKLAEERDLFKTLMETSPSGISVVDKNGQIIFSNRRAEEIIGMTDEEKSTDRSYDSPEWKHTDYDGNPWLDEQQPFVRVMQTKQSVWDVRHAIEWSNGRKVYLSINGTPVFDASGEVDKVIFTIEDYTDRKHQQDALEAALEREKHLNKLKSNFVSMASHEFRTPLTIISTSADIIRRKIDTITPDQLGDRLDKISNQIRHIARLLSEVTFINKDDMIGLALESKPLDLTKLIQQIVDEIEVVYPTHLPVRVSINVPQTEFLSDESLLQKIIINLLSNAMKYSPLESEVIFSCALDQQTLILTVKDEGIGIPARDQGNLFNEFHRGHNVGTIQGTGLGLAIVRRAVTALDGQIEFESTEQNGTTFLVKLPIMAIDASAHR